MVLKLYYNGNDAPVRAVVYTLNALNIPHEKIEIRIRFQEQKTEKFLKMNPQHTIPTIEDEDGFILWDSHAINVYLTTRYGKDDKLYPKELKARAIVDQRLHFHNGVFFVSFSNIIDAVFVKRCVNKITPEVKQPVEEALDFLEKFLADGRQFVAGNNVTIADFSIATTITNLTVFMPSILIGYPLVSKYYKRIEAVVPGFQEMEAKAIKSIKEILPSLLPNFKLEESNAV